MRLEEVVLERYGAFEEKRLALDASPFTIVFGPNEAGKSTFLSAISDFFFKIREGSSALSRFGSDVARIHATVRSADGRLLRLQRRYGRVRTLIGEDGSACDDVLLSGLLGATTRDRFENLFGVGHEALRKGGDALLRPDGDIGRLIVEAGGGLRTLVDRLAAMEAEIDGLFAPRRKESRLFYSSLIAFEEANKSARAAMLTHDAWDRVGKARAAAAVALDGARLSKRRAAEELSRSRRLEATIPHLRVLDAIEERLSSFGDVATLDDHLPVHCEEASRADGAAASALAEATARNVEVTGRRDLLTLQDRWERFEADVREVGRRIDVVASARTSRANRDKDRREAESQLAALRERLRQGPEVDLTVLMPEPAVLDVVRALILREPGLLAAVRSRKEAAADAAAAVEACAGRIALLTAGGFDKPFGMSTSAFDALPAQEAAATRKRKQGDDMVAACRDRAAAVGLPDLAALRGLPWPSEEAVRSEVRARDANRVELAGQAAVKADARRGCDVALATIAALERGGAPTSAEAVAEARRVRDEAWLALRRAHFAGDPERDPDGREADAAALEAAIREADLLADRRLDQVERATAVAQARLRCAEAEAAMGAAARTMAELEAVAADRERRFREAFPRACAVRSDVVALLDATIERRAILSSLEMAESARAEGQAAAGELEPVHARLRAAERIAGVPEEPTGALALRVARLSAAVAAHDEAHERHRRELADLVRMRAASEAKARAARDAHDDLDGWRREWAPGVAGIGLPADATVAVAEALVAGWIGAKGDLRSLAITARRIEAMDEDEADLRDRVAILAERLAVVVPDDPVIGGAMLVERWKADETARQAHFTLAPEVASATRALDVCRDRKAAAEGRLAALAIEAGAADSDELMMKAGRRRELGSLRARRDSVISDVRQAGDGLPIEVLREQCAGRDLDETRAQVVDLAREVERRDAELEAAIRAEEAASASLFAHEGRVGTEGAVAKREAAAASMRDAIERYLELVLARNLVNEAIKIVRTEQQDPLVRSAGSMFAAMTRGEFSGIQADVDANGMPTVVGVRGDGCTPTRIALMSDGTRDQLYLAFRLASLANYSAAAEPIPLIADDALVHFDDDRSAATMELLADFSARTQVLLFTHHRSVRDVGACLAHAGRAALLDLS